MKWLFFAALYVLGSCEVFDGWNYIDAYTDRYNIRYASFDALFSPTRPGSKGIKALTNTTVIDNARCQNISLYAMTPTLAQLVNFHHELVDLCPQLYQTIRYENITTWGPVDEFLQIWYMKFVDALWLKIQARTCRCQLYDDFVNGAATAGDTALRNFLEANYDPGLCEINDQTMYKWNLFLNKPEIKNRAIKLIRVGEFSIPVIHEIAKAYLTNARYQMYFEGPPYPISTYLNASGYNTTAWYTPTRALFRAQAKSYDRSFPSLDLAARQRYFSMGYAKRLDDTFWYFGQYNPIPLDPVDEIIYYHLQLYLCRRDFLKAKRLQYSSPPATCTTTSTTTTTTTITTTTTTTTTPAPCLAPPNTAPIYIENGVEFDDDEWFPQVDPVDTCDAPNGVTAFYNGLIPYPDPAYVGKWVRDGCTSPCMCTAQACYKAEPENPTTGEPDIFLYPFCETPENCFVVALFYTPGSSLVNPLNSTDAYTFDDQQYAFYVTDPQYPRITRVGCNAGCPFVA